jgi:hypothetical protein
MKTVLVALSLVAASARAEEVEQIDTVEVVDVQEVGDDLHGEAWPVIDRAFTLMNGRTLRPQSWEVVIAHRTGAPLRKNPFYDYVGFDSGGLKIGLGLRYGVLDRLDIGVYRLNGTVEPFDTYELDGRYQLVKRQDHGFDLALRAGVSWFSAEGNNASAFLGQLLGSTLVADRLTLGAGLLFHSDSTNEKKTREDDKSSTAVMGLTELRVLDWLALDLEVAANVGGYSSQIPIFTFGPKIVTNRHSFAFVVTNSQYMSADGVVANTPRAPKRWILGFNITREI